MQAREISRNFPDAPASNPMSSPSGAEFETSEPQEPINLTARREIELLRKAQSGDRTSYGQLVVTYQDRLYNALLRMVGDSEEARELTQEAFTRDLMKLSSFRGDAQPYTWLFRIAVNLAISHLRKVQRHRGFSLDAPPRNGNGRQRDGGSGDDQASSLADRVSRDGSGKAAAALPPDDLERKELHGQVLTALG